jgi:beta-aspartyl-peptidase (threonine type)
MSAILVHGGAGAHRGDTRPRKLLGVRAAADAGWDVLASGGSALDAVEAATRVLEADPLFDAGRGSYPNADGIVEVDAVIMDGATLGFGAVAAVPCVLHAVTLARRVMTATPHSFLVGPGAERLARAEGLLVPAADLLSPEALAYWHERRAAAAATAQPGGTGTVGAVALDAAGHVAAATSTGGTCNKWPGRVGDTPVVGAGAYADDAHGAVSSTGHGESILRVCLAFQASHALGAGSDPMAVARWAIALLGERTGGEGGLILAGADGRLGWAWNTDAMPYAWRDGSGGGEGL